MSTQYRELFESYVVAGLRHDADAQAEMFTEDGVFEAPLVPPGGVLPRRLEGREAIRRGLAEYHRRATGTAFEVNVANSKYELHTTGEPDVFVAEIDTALRFEGVERMMSLVHIYRLRDGRIALLRDYFGDAAALFPAAR